MKKNLIAGQSGGPTASINASLSGIIRRAMRDGAVGEVYGMLNGIEGLTQGRVVDLRKSIHRAEDFARLSATPAMALGSCRYKLPAPPHADYEAIRRMLNDYNVGYFLYIGGNDSMDTVKQLSAYFAEKGDDIRCVGIPKTIDNDLPVTDHTPGFASAAKYIITSIAEAVRDSEVYGKSNVLVFEIMGRNAGWLTAASVLARDTGCAAPQIICLPETPFDPTAFMEAVKVRLKEGELLGIAVSEGLKLADGAYVSAAGGAKDPFGHAALAGTGRYLEERIRSELGCKVRSIEFSILQRAASHCASRVDIEEAARIGEEGAAAAIAGKSGVMMAFRRVSNEPYHVEIVSVSIEQCANLEKTVPQEWITGGGFDVGREMAEYLRPMLRRRAPVFETEGIPDFFALDKSIAAPTGFRRPRDS
jgi:6-phosphofructokinase 1